MDFATKQDNGETHSPQRHRPPRHRSLLQVLIALFGAPAAWLAQMSLSEPIAAYTCYPQQVPLSAPLWVELPAILAAISLACLAAGLFSAYVAWIFWRQSAGTGMAISQGNDSPSAVIDGGQNRFLAVIGLMSSSLFVIAILFTCFAVFLVSPCSAWT
jgi:hypothetical protein